MTRLYRCYCPAVCCEFVDGVDEDDEPSDIYCDFTDDPATEIMTRLHLHTDRCGWLPVVGSQP